MMDERYFGFKSIDWNKVLNVKSQPTSLEQCNTAPENQQNKNISSALNFNTFDYEAKKSYGNKLESYLNDERTENILFTKIKTHYSKNDNVQYNIPSCSVLGHTYSSSSNESEEEWVRFKPNLGGNRDARERKPIDCPLKELPPEEEEQFVVRCRNERKSSNGRILRQPAAWIRKENKQFADIHMNEIKMENDRVMRRHEELPPEDNKQFVDRRMNERKSSNGRILRQPAKTNTPKKHHVPVVNFSSSHKRFNSKKKSKKICVYEEDQRMQDEAEKFFASVRFLPPEFYVANLNDYAGSGVDLFKNSEERPSYVKKTKSAVQCEDNFIDEYVKPNVPSGWVAKMIPPPADVVNLSEISSTEKFWDEDYD